MGSASSNDGGVALVIVRNPCTHDSRVLREARVLRRLGYQPSVLGVVSTEERALHASVDGIQVQRLAPSSPLAWIRSRLRRSHEAKADDSATEGGTREPGRVATPLVRVHRWLRTLDFYRRAIRVVRAERPALVHCNDYNTMWIGVAARALGAGVVYDAHELWPDRNLRPEPRWWLLACEALFVRAAGATITTSPGYAEVIARRYRTAPPTVVRNIPELTPSANGRPAPAEPDAGDRGQDGLGPITYLGALTRNRGLEVAIEALALMPGARLRLVGPIHAPYRAELDALARDREVSGRLEFAGAVPPSQAVDSIRGAGAGLALIQPACLSYELSLPNKLFEYLLAGVPVLAADLPVIGDFVRRHGVGLVARPADAADVAEKLAALLEPERNRELRTAVRRVAAELSWERESKLLEAAYAEAAGGRGGSG